jgi:hypothetical protein
MTWPTSNPIARELDDFWKESQSLIQQWWYEADLDTKMMTGQQDYWNTFYNINYRNQKILMFNKILRIKNMIQGYQIDNRLASIVSPADNDHDEGKTADQRTTLISWIMRQDQTYERISETFGAEITCGLNLMQAWMDFREDPENGEIKTSRIPFNAFVMDPYWTKQDLSDCGRIWTRRYLGPKEIGSLVPGIKKDLPKLGKGYAAKDGKFQFLAQNWYQYQQELYAYDEYWVRDYKKKRRIIDRATGEMADWKGTREQFQLLRRFNPNVELVTVEVPTIKWHVLVNNNLVYEEKEPYGLERFPHVPFVCYHFPEVQNYAYRYQGVVRNIRDSQIELNRRRNRLLDVLDAQVQSGLIAKEDALVNPEDAYKQGPGSVLFAKQTANLSTDIIPIAPPPVAPGWMELIETIEKEIMDIVGPEELFAQNMGAKEMTGVLMKLKMGAGLIGLRNIFDNLNQSQMCLSEIILDLALKNFTPSKVANVLGEEPTPEFFDYETFKYKCVVEESDLTTTQRQLKFLQAMQLKQLFGDAIPTSYVIEQSTVQGKKELLDFIKAQEQQTAESQKMQFMSEMQQAQVLARSLEAKAQSDFASANEKNTRSVSNIALAIDREEEGVLDRAKASFENAKALHELEDMNEDRLIKLANFVIDLQTKQKQLEGLMKAETEAAIISEPVNQVEKATSPLNQQAVSL